MYCCTVVCCFCDVESVNKITLYHYFCHSINQLIRRFVKFVTCCFTCIYYETVMHILEEIVKHFIVVMTNCILPHSL